MLTWSVLSADMRGLKADRDPADVRQQMRDVARRTRTHAVWLHSLGHGGELCDCAAAKKTHVRPTCLLRQLLHVCAADN